MSGQILSYPFQEVLNLSAAVKFQRIWLVGLFVGCLVMYSLIWRFLFCFFGFFFCITASGQLLRENQVQRL